MTGSQSSHRGSIVSKAIGECPEVTACLAGREVCCLIDMGAQVSTITESLFSEHFAQRDLVDVSTVIKIKGSYGLNIPYIGYVELSLSLAGEEFPDMGFLVVKDPVDEDMRRRKSQVPVVIGSNVLRDIRRKREQQPEKGGFSSSVLEPILALYGETRIQEPDTHCVSRVRVASQRPILIPARSLKVFEGSVQPAHKGQMYCALIEEAVNFTGPRFCIGSLSRPGREFWEDPTADS